MKVFEISVAVVLFVAVIVLSVFTYAIPIFFYWDWFAVQALGLGSITFVQAVAINMLSSLAIVRIIAGMSNIATKSDVGVIKTFFDHAVSLVGFLVFLPLLLLFFGWVVFLIIV